MKLDVRLCCERTSQFYILCLHSVSSSTYRPNASSVSFLPPKLTFSFQSFPSQQTLSSWTSSWFLSSVVQHATTIVRLVCLSDQLACFCFLFFFFLPRESFGCEAAREFQNLSFPSPSRAALQLLCQNFVRAYDPADYYYWLLRRFFVMLLLLLHRFKFF